MRAAAAVLKRQLCIYENEKVAAVAAASGYKIDASGNLCAVKDEYQAFTSLIENTKEYFGPFAAIDCNTTLMVSSSLNTQQFLNRIADDSLDLISSVANMPCKPKGDRINNNGLTGPVIDDCSVIDEPGESYLTRIPNTKKAYAENSFLQRMFGWLL
jgi:hypothetical protein